MPFIQNEYNEGWIFWDWFFLFSSGWSSQVQQCYYKHRRKYYTYYINVEQFNIIIYDASVYIFTEFYCNWNSSTEFNFNLKRVNVNFWKLYFGFDQESEFILNRNIYLC